MSDNIWARVNWKNHLFKENFGWKIHLSVHANDFAAVLRICKKYAFKVNIPIKFVKLDRLGDLNQGVFGNSQIGKHIVLYTITPTATATAIAWAHRNLSKYRRGPVVAGDLFAINPYSTAYIEPGCRFGTISMRMVMGDSVGVLKEQIILPTGSRALEKRFDEFDEIGDREFFDWANLQMDSGSSLSIKRWNFNPEWQSEIETILEQPVTVKPKKGAQGGGKVFLEILDPNDRKPMAFLKGCRSLIGQDRYGTSLEDALRNEWNITTHLSTTRPATAETKVLFPSPLGFGSQPWGSYIIFSYIPMRPIDVLQKGVRISYINQIGAAITELHQQGVVHADLKLSQFAIEKKTNQVVLLDFETSGFEGDIRTSNRHTRGYNIGRDARHQRYSYRDDWAAFSSVVFHLITGWDPSHLQISRRKMRSLLLATKAPTELVKIYTSTALYGRKYSQTHQNELSNA